MKKRMLSAFLCLCMMLTMVPAAFAADQTVDGTDGLVKALQEAKPGDTVAVSQKIDLDGTKVTVPAGVTLNAGDYLITGEVQADAGSSVYVVADDTQYIIGSDSLNITSGSATINFTEEGTTTTIDKGAEAEIVGPFMNNTGKGDHTYRLPENDEMVVDGKLTVKHNMTAVGKLSVNGSVEVADGSTLFLKKMASEDDTVRMKVADGGSVTVQNGAALDVGEYYAQGSVTASAGSTIYVVDDDTQCQMIGDSSLDITSGTATISFTETGTTTTISEGSKADVVGTFMDSGDSNDAYRVPKNDTLVVAGELTVAGSTGDFTGMEVAGKMNVKGKVTVSSGTLELVTLRSGGQSGSMEIAASASVFVKSGATLSGDKGTATGEGAIYKESGATVTGMGDINIYAIYTVTFDPNGGKFADESTDSKSLQTSWEGTLTDEAVQELTPVKGGASFGGWQFEDGNGFSTDYAFTADTTLKAAWDEDVAGEAEVSPAAPSVAEPNLPDATEEEVQMASSVKEALTSSAAEVVKGSDLSQAAMDAAQKNKITVEQGKQELEKAQVTVSEGETVSIVVQPYMAITIEDVSLSDGSSTITLDIAPMYRTVATTDVEDIQLDGESKNAVQIGNAEGLNISGSVEMTIPLPENYTEASTLYINHVKNNRTYVYTGSVADNKLTFTNPHGFSQFIITSAAPVAAIGEVGFTSLQDAVNEVENNGTIKLMADNLSATVSREVTFTVDADGHTGLNLTAGSGYSMSVNSSTYTFAHTGGGSTGGGGGGGGAASNTNSVSAPSTQNGKVTVSPSNAAEGATVTITVTPDKGYELGTLTVTDADGNNVSLTKKSDTQYTFTMPDSKVTVKATFAEITEQPAALPFSDIASSAWYADAVRYVYENGMMNGTSATQFSPNTTTNRAMIVTILYRLENEPSASVSGFTDVAAGSYYADAVAWAASNGIVNGVSATSFAPNAPITREQMAAILYRYAQFKGYNTAAGSSLSGFSDASRISPYATTAMQWANSNGLITGVTSTTLDPQGSATRAQVATILMRFCEDIAK